MRAVVMSCVGTVTGIRNISHVSLVEVPIIIFFCFATL